MEILLINRLIRTVEYLRSVATYQLEQQIENMLLEATKFGLGTLWIANSCFAYPELMKYVRTSDQLVSIVAVSCLNENPDMRHRKSMEDIIEYRE